MKRVVRPTPDDLPAFLPYACGQLCLEFDLKITVVMEDEFVSKLGSGDKSIKKKKSTNNIKKNQSVVLQPEQASFGAETSSRVAEEESVSSSKVVRMTCVVAGPARATVALDLDRNCAVPRDLLRLLHLCAPYNKQLRRFSARWSELHPAALHELVTLLPLGNITDVRLDNTRAGASDCRALLDAGRLRRLSLAGCQLGDEGCAAVAEALVFPRPASLTLAALSLASNAIGNTGAIALARALRSNRSLRLLDLADNRLHDEGAIAILRTVNEFQLTLEDILAGLQHRMERALRHAEALRRCLRVMRCSALPEADEAREGRRPAHAPRASRSRAELEAAAVAAMAAHELGPSFNPFPPEETVQRGGQLRSRGNTVLNCLNLAYNSLSMVSVRALLVALRGQAEGTGGLGRVLLDGNPLPASAPEYDAAAALMEHALFALATTNKQHQLKKKISKKTMGLLNR